jgi:autophagy-related protein 18
VGTGTGDVLIFDALSLQVVNIVQAHKSPVACVVTNADGTLMATASDKGTVIRVFSLPDAHKLYQFRRGSYPARIYSISFNLVSTLLCTSSDQETVHIFKLVGKDGVPLHSGAEDMATPMGGVHKPSYGKTIKKSVTGYLPDMLTEIWEPSRDFANLKLKTAGVKSLVALSSTTPQVMVVTSEGYLYTYNIDLENGGECTLLKQYSLLDPADDATPNHPSFS